VQQGAALHPSIVDRGASADVERHEGPFWLRTGCRGEACGEERRECAVEEVVDRDARLRGIDRVPLDHASLLAAGEVDRRGEESGVQTPSTVFFAHDEAAHGPDAFVIERLTSGRDDVARATETPLRGAGPDADPAGRFTVDIGDDAWWA